MFFVQVVLMSETFIIGGFSRAHTRWKGTSDFPWIRSHMRWKGDSGLPLTFWQTNDVSLSRNGSRSCCSCRRTPFFVEASSLVMVKSYFTVMTRCSKSNVTNEKSNIPSNKHRNATRALHHIFVFAMVSTWIYCPLVCATNLVDCGCKRSSFPLSSAHAFRRIAHNSRSQSVDMCFEQHTILGERKHKLCHLPKKRYSQLHIFLSFVRG